MKFVIPLIPLHKDVNININLIDIPHCENHSEVSF